MANKPEKCVSCGKPPSATMSSYKLLGVPDPNLTLEQRYQQHLNGTSKTKIIKTSSQPICKECGDYS